MNSVSKMLLFTVLFCTWQKSVAQNFITRWNMANSGFSPTQLRMGTETSGIVNYTWQEISPGTQSGSGSWSGNLLIISGLTAGSVIRLQIAPANFQRININNGTDRTRLVDVESWGNTAWTSMERAFTGCTNMQISASDVPNLSAVTNMSFMFSGASTFNQDISNWNTAAVTNMNVVFNGASAFNQNIGNWNTAAVTNMLGMFNGASSFNQNIGNWNTAEVTDMSSMFNGASAFNQNIGNWNTAAVTNMRLMFSSASAFNQNIGNWNTVAVTDMSSMFNGASSFNQNIGNWNTAAVTTMASMFGGASSFNQNIGNWNTASVSSMTAMFSRASVFNQNIGNWNTAAVSNMTNMFNGASAFNQNIGTWPLRSAGVTMTNMLINCDMDCSNYSATLMGWAISSTPSNSSLGASGRHYSSMAVASRLYLTSVKGWTISGDARIGGTPIFFGSGQSHTTLALCGEKKIIHPTDLSRKIIDYNANGNTFTPTNVTINNLGSLIGGGGTFTNNASAFYQSTDGSNTLRVSKRMHSIEVPGSYPVNGGIIVRVYYNPSENNSLTSLAWPGSSPMVSSGWFQCSGNTAQSVVNDMTPTQLNNAVPITPTASGTESGISYVEFTVTQFSTFVFAATAVQVLPIELQSFTSNCQKRNVVLNWSTASELNNDYFTIERSLDGKNWDMIGKVNGMGNSNRNQNYLFTDETPLKGKSYYRLKQTDFDGKDTYFNIISSSCEGIGEFSISPNPSTNGIFTISVPEQNSDVVITDALGKIILETKINEEETQIDLSNQIPGVYMVRVSSGFGISSKKIAICK
ncbi:MAG: BspA family leucine-rich repeat surface protein [Saprospiraceae bacterium]|nr:BspA family leucine-rich repeat surface protein [Saprospiraceae bacterium]